MVAITDKVTIEARFEGQNLRQGTAQASRDMKRFEDSVEKAEKENKRLRRELDRVQKELKQTAVAARSTGNAMKGMDKSAALLKRGLAGLAVYMSVGALKDYGDEWTNLNNRIRLFTKSSAETQKVLDGLYKVSQQTRTSVATTAEVYQRFAMANETLNMSQERLVKLMKTINQAVLISGVSSEAASAALVQLGQGMAAGALRGEELNSVLEQTPGLAMAIAKGMGVGLGDLKRLGEEGKITAEQVVGALESQAESLEKQAAKMNMTIGQAFTLLDNAFGKLLDDFSKVSGVFDGIAAAINHAAEGIDKLNRASEGRGLTTFLQMMIPFVGYIPAAVEMQTNLNQQAATARATQGGKDRRRRAGAAGLDPYPIPGVVPVAADATGQAAINQRMENIVAILESQGRAIPEQFQAAKQARDNRQWAMGMTDADLDFDFGEAVIPELQEVKQAFEALPLKDRTVELELLHKTWEAAAVTQMEQLELAQRHERISFEKRTNDKLLLAELDKLHEAEQQKLQDTIDAEKATEKLADNMQTLQTVTGAVVGLLNQMGKTELAGLVGAGGGFAMTMMDPTATPIQKVVSGINLATEAFSFLAPEVDDTAAAEREYQQALRQTRMEIQNNVEGLLGSNKIFRDAQRDATKFIREDFEAFMPKGDTWKRLRDFLGEIGRDAQNLEEDYGATAGGMIEAISDSMRTIRIHEGDDGADELHAFEVSLLRWRELAELFGEDTGITDIYNEALRMEDGFNTLSRSMKRTTEELAPLTRSIRMGFDVEEMQFRRRAQGRMALAGSDPYLQNRVFRDLSRSIDRLRSRESAEMRAIRTGTGAATVTVGSGGGGGTTSGGTTDTTTTDAGALVPEIRIAEIHLDEWADAVDVSNAEPINKNWNEIVPLIGSGTGHKRIDPVKWWNVVELKTMDTKTGRINKEWNEIVPLIGSGTGHKRIDPEFWYNVVELKTMDTRVGRIQKTWNEIIPMIGAVPGAKEKRINPGDWDVVIEVSDLNKNPIERNWHQVVQMGAKINVNRWSDVFTFGQMVQGGGTAPMARMSLGWGDIFNLDNMGTIDLDVGAAVRLVGERAKINISDLIDMSELDGVITNAVNRGLRDRSVAVNQGGANSSSGTATTRQFRGPSRSTMSASEYSATTSMSRNPQAGRTS